MNCVARRLRLGMIQDERGCWVWQRAIDPNGYGRIGVGGGMEYVHRVAAALFCGPIPEGMDVDHLCRNRACANPMHLEIVTRRENLLRGQTLTAAHAAGVDCGFEPVPILSSTSPRHRVSRGCVVSGVCVVHYFDADGRSGVA